MTSFAVDIPESTSKQPFYCGRLAPTPTGGLHLGHARTFKAAWDRARQMNGDILLRIEDLDAARCKPEFIEQQIEELTWLGLEWDGPILYQSRRRELYLNVWTRLKDAGVIYPCTRSRKDLRGYAEKPSGDEQDTEPLYPPEWRPPPGVGQEIDQPGGEVTWRFRVPDGETLTFKDDRLGEVSFTAGCDFGDFSVWRRDDVPAYELAVVVDDIDQNITEVVRGEDLLRSTARQLLLYRALKATPPAWRHEPLVRDAQGHRLAKRARSKSVQAMREEGVTPAEIWRDLRGG